MTELDAALTLRLLREEQLMKPGESERFTLNICGKLWEMELKRESEIYAPFKYGLTGHCIEPTSVGTYRQWARRYTSMDAALLACFNHFNENANVRNRFNSIEDVFTLRK